MLMFRVHLMKPLGFGRCRFTVLLAAAAELIPFTERETRLGRRQLRPIRQRDVMDQRDVEMDELTRFDSVVFKIK